MVVEPHIEPQGPLISISNASQASSDPPTFRCEDGQSETGSIADANIDKGIHTFLVDWYGYDTFAVITPSIKPHMGWAVTVCILLRTFEQDLAERTATLSRESEIFSFAMFVALVRKQLLHVGWQGGHGITATAK